MLADVFKDLIAEFSFLLKGILAMIAVAISLAAALLAFRQYKIAMFLENPRANSEKFDKFYTAYGHNYHSIKDAAQDYLHHVKLSEQYKQLYERQDKARQLYYERRDSYRYIKAPDNYNYRGFDDDYEDDE